MQSWVPDLAAEAAPKYLAIAAALSRDIEAGVLKPGDRLPPQRALAERLDVDLTTVTKAYNEVRRLGLIEGGGRRGSFVRADVGGQAEATGAVLTDTGMNLPPEPQAGRFAMRFRDGVAELLAGPGAAGRFQYQPSGGAQADRAAGAALLAARGIDASEDTVLVASGGQNALHAILGTLFSPGDTICAGRFAYPGFLALARRFGLTVRPIDMDGEGIDPDALDAACRAGDIRALYIVPTNDNPTAATMGEARRRRLAEVARTYDLTIVEDDAYGLLPAAPLPPIAAYAPERTWHVTSLSKIISPALRIAYLHAPSPRAAWRLAAELHETAIMPPPVSAALATLWLRDGGFASLVAEVRAEALARQAIAAGILGDLDYATHPEGYHLWLKLPPGAVAGTLVGTLRPAGLSVVGSDAFAVDAADTGQALRISIGGGLSRERLARTLHMLDAMLQGEGRAAIV
jgi:DNA-binding transcriptional MocR family regulator